MKNKKGIIIGVIFLAIVVLGGMKINDYYQDRYVGKDYYVRVPQDQSTELEDILDMSNRVVGKGRKYELLGYNTAGESRMLSFTYTTEDPAKLLQPGQYLKVSASKQIVVGQSVIQESDVPADILKLINQ